jgi:hypothetical protein
MDNEKPLAETITETIQEKLIGPINDTLKTLLQFGEAPPSENVVDLLKADHRKVQSLFKEFENAEGKTDKVSILKTILEELTLHTIAEERLVYSRIGESSDQDEQEKVYEAFEEHEAAQNLISQLSKFTGDEENFEAKVKLLEEMIKHHVTEEELDLLPKLDESREELEELGREFQDEKDDLKDQHATFEPPAEKPEPVMHKARKSVARAAKRPAAQKAAPKRGAKTAAKSTAKKSTAKKVAEKKSPARKTAAKKSRASRKSAAKPKKASTASAKKATTTKKATVKKPAAGSKRKKASTRKSKAA